MSLIRQSSLVATTAVMLTASRFVFMAILARRLSVDDFGRFAYAQWMVDIVFLVCALGATGAVSRYAAELRHDAGRLTSFMRAWRRWAGGVSVAGGLVVIAAVWLSPYSLSRSELVLLGAWAAANGLMAMQSAAMVGLQRFDLVFRSNLIFAGISLAGAVTLTANMQGSAGLFAVMAAACAMASVPGLAMLAGFKRHNSTPLKPDQWRGIRRYALNMWVVALLWSLLWSRGEFPLVKAMLGDAEVASYAAILTLFAGAIQGVMLGVSAVASELSRLWGEGSKAEAVSLARRVMDAQLISSGIGATFLLFFGPELLQLAFGHKYGAQSNTLAIISVGLISMAAANQNHLLQISTEGRFSRDSLLVGVVVLFALAFLMTRWLGLDGTAAARALTMLLLAGFALWSAVRRWGAGAVSVQNIMAVMLIATASLALTLVFGGELRLLDRGILFLGAASLVCGLVRDECGTLAFASISRKLISACKKCVNRIRLVFNG